jgi:hypothetical protein
VCEQGPYRSGESTDVTPIVAPDGGEAAVDKEEQDRIALVRAMSSIDSWDFDVGVAVVVTVTVAVALWCVRGFPRCPL